MRFDRLHISWNAAQHIWDEHRLETLEVREAFEDAGRRKAIYRGPNSRDGGRTYLAQGRTQAGKPLWIEHRLVSRYGSWSNTEIGGWSP